MLSRKLQKFLETSTSGTKKERKKEQQHTHTNNPNSLYIGKVVSDDLSQLREVPSIQRSRSHRVVGQLFVSIIQYTDSLDYHCVYLVWAELRLVPAKAIQIYMHTYMYMHAHKCVNIHTT